MTCSSWTTAAVEESIVLQGSGRVGNTSLWYWCSLLGLISYLCKEQQIQQKRLSEKDTFSLHSEGWKRTSDVLTFFIVWNSFLPGPFQGDEGKCSQHDSSLLYDLCRFSALILQICMRALPSQNLLIPIYSYTVMGTYFSQGENY